MIELILDVNRNKFTQPLAFRSNQQSQLRWTMDGREVYMKILTYQRYEFALIHDQMPTNWYSTEIERSICSIAY